MATYPMSKRNHETNELDIRRLVEEEPYGGLVGVDSVDYSIADSVLAAVEPLSALRPDADAGCGSEGTLNAANLRG